MSEKKKKKTQTPPTTLAAVELDEKWVIAGCVAIYALIVVWGLLSKGTWDDDCPMRYYNVRQALNDPKMFINVWNRPLFTLLYVLPMQLGRITVIFQTALIAVLAGYFVYRAAKELRLPNAYLAIPFTVLQAFYFPVAFNALTEPLAALILALGVFFLARKNYLAFAIAGSLLPLARLELAILLAFCALFLLKDRQWKYIPILALPALLWNLAGALVNGDWLWLYHQVFTGQENRYGHGSFWQYFHRFIYLTGPVVFYFTLLGLGERLYRRRFDFTLSQFAFGFLVYVLFSWKFSIGHAAGFLRNLLPLSPLAGLLALEGYNLWIGPERDRSKNFRVLFYSVAVIIITLVFLSRKLVIHHIVGNEPEYVKLLIITGLTFIFLLTAFLLENFAGKRAAQFSLAALVVGSSLAYTLITEPPIGLIPERAAMYQLADWYEQNNLQQHKTFSNHIWFYYAKEYDYFDETRFGRMKKAYLEQAPKSSVVIWESHYSHRLSGDVPFEYFTNNSSFKEIGRLVTPGQNFAAVIFQKQ